MAENGLLAIDLFRVQSFDLVLMDIQMPVMDGYETTRQMRIWEKETNATPTPILALTAHAMAEETGPILDAGCDQHLTKPIRKQRLLSVINHYAVGTA